MMEIVLLALLLMNTAINIYALKQRQAMINYARIRKGKVEKIKEIIRGKKRSDQSTRSNTPPGLLYIGFQGGAQITIGGKIFNKLFSAQLMANMKDVPKPSGMEILQAPRA